MIPQIMIPLVGEVKEFDFVKKIVVATADKLIADAGVELKYEVGTMIEIPRAALTADKIAADADFFCYGTNDLTQMTFGFSRDDAGKFLDAYYDNKIYESDPFVHIDRGWRWPSGRDERKGWPRSKCSPPPGHLRRARRRPDFRRVLP